MPSNQELAFKVLLAWNDLLRDYRGAKAAWHNPETKDAAISGKQFGRWISANGLPPQSSIEGLLRVIEALYRQSSFDAGIKSEMTKIFSERAPPYLAKIWSSHLAGGVPRRSLVDTFNQLLANQGRPHTLTEKSDNQGSPALLSDFASTVSLPVAIAGRKYANAQAKWTPEAVAEYRKNVSQFATRSNRRAALINFYGLGYGPQGLRAIVVKRGSKVTHLAVYSSKKYQFADKGLSSTGSREVAAVEIQALPKYRFPIDVAIDVFSRIIASPSALFFNGAMFRLYDLTPVPLRFAFSSTTYFQHRFGCALMQDELDGALIEGKGTLQKPRTTLPIRGACLPNLVNIADLTNRICVGGISVVVAFATDERDKEFAIPIAQRSSDVLENAASTAVLPSGFHTPNAMVDDPAQRRLESSVLRECYEELFNGADVEEQAATRGNPAWFLNEPSMTAFLSSGELDFKLLGVGFAADSGVYVCSILVIAKNPKCWANCAPYMKVNRETQHGKLRIVRTRDSAQIERLLDETSWADESLTTFCLSLKYLERKHPRRVALPRFSVGLVDTDRPVVLRKR